MKRRQRHHLLHVDIGSAGNLFHPVRDLLRDEVVALHISAGDLNIDRRRQSKVQDLSDDVGGLEEKLDARKAARQFFTQSADVLPGGMVMLRIQTNQDFRVAGANHAGIAVRKIDARIRQPNVVEDRHQFVFWDLLSKILLDVIGQPRRFFNAQPGTGPQMKPHQTGVNRREEVFAKEEHQAHRQNAEREKASREQFLMSEGGFQKLVITTAKLLETALERSLVTPEDRLWSSSLMLMTPHDVHHQRRDQG